MRQPVLVFVAMLFCASSLHAQPWQRFGVEELGFIFDVPPGFVLAQHSQGGAVFRAKKDAVLAVWGVRLAATSFRSEIEHRMMQDERDGWQLTYRRLTPNWVSYSGLKDGRIRYVRAIRICGDRAALFALDYNREEKRSYDLVVVRMVRSLRVEGC